MICCLTVASSGTYESPKVISPQGCTAGADGYELRSA
jgi:hypothetical protein